MTKYVVGFMLRANGESIVLIQKSKPKWQVGLLNGVGGKIDGSETANQAMAREYSEEAGVRTNPEDWREFANLVGESFHVTCFVCRNDEYYNASRTMESEQIVKKRVGLLGFEKCVSNVEWLVHLGLDLNYGNPPMVVATYPTP